MERGGEFPTPQDLLGVLTSHKKASMGTHVSGSIEVLQSESIKWQYFTELEEHLVP